MDLDCSTRTGTVRIRIPVLLLLYNTHVQHYYIINIIPYCIILTLHVTSAQYYGTIEKRQRQVRAVNGGPQSPKS